MFPYMPKPTRPYLHVHGGYEKEASRHICMYMYIYICIYTYVTCSAIWGLLDEDDDLRASHELLNTERVS